MQSRVGAGVNLAQVQKTAAIIGNVPSRVKEAPKIQTKNEQIGSQCANLGGNMNKTHLPIGV